MYIKIGCFDLIQTFKVPVYTVRRIFPESFLQHPGEHFQPVRVVGQTKFTENQSNLPIFSRLNRIFTITWQHLRGKSSRIDPCPSANQWYSPTRLRPVSHWRKAPKFVCRWCELAGVNPIISAYSRNQINWLFNNRDTVGIKQIGCLRCSRCFSRQFRRCQWCCHSFDGRLRGNRLVWCISRNSSKLVWKMKIFQTSGNTVIFQS